MKRILFFLIILVTSSVSALEDFDVAGHRGARGLKPENTLPAFETALDLGVTTLEMDLHFTADEVVVVWHDPYILKDKCRLDSSDSVAPDPAILSPNDERLLISQLSFEQLQEYQCDLNPDPTRFPNQNNEPTPIAGDNYRIHSLEEIFNFVELYATSDLKSTEQRDNAMLVQFNVETKRDPDNPVTINDDFDGVNAGRFELAILALVETYGYHDQVIIQSFDHRSLYAIRKESESIRLAGLTFGALPRFTQFEEYNIDIWSPYYEDLTLQILIRIHDSSGSLADMQVIPWTVNEHCTMQRLIDWGVDGLITDHPDVLMNQIADESDISPNTLSIQEIEARNKATYRRYVEEGIGQGNVGVVQEVFACDVVGYWALAFQNTPVNIETYQIVIYTISTGYTDSETTIETIIAEGDMLATHFIWRGKLQDSPFEIAYNSISRFNEEGRIIEEWLLWDHLDMLQQFGLLAPTGELLGQ